MKIWNVNMDKLNEDDLNDCETFMLIDYILAMRKKIEELQIEVKQIGHSFIQKGGLLNKALDTIKAKEQECEELKEEIATVRMEICNQCGEKIDYNIPCKQIRDLDYGLQLEIEENDKLKQTLTEIKNKLTVHKTLYYESKLIEKLHKQILQKISECEE